MAGFIYACTSHGVFAFDGRRFFNLGVGQGLPEGGRVSDVIFIGDGRVVIRYAADIYVSRMALGAAQSPRELRFTPVAGLSHTGLSQSEQITPWRRGAMLIADGRPIYLNTDDPDRPQVTPLGLPAAEAAALRAPNMIQAVDGRVWLGFLDGRVCSYDDAEYACYDADKGLPSGRWDAFLSDDHGRVIARAATVLATIDPGRRTVSTEALPFQDGMFIGRLRRLDLERLPSGDLITQSVGGFMIRHHRVWKQFTAADGLPATEIGMALPDQQGNLWFVAAGHGLYRLLGFGQWENRDHRDGLMSDVTWQAVREPGGPLWIATDAGLDSVSTGGAAPVRSSFPGPAYSMALGAPGHLWRNDGTSGVSCTDLHTGAVESFPIGNTTQLIRGNDNRVWISADTGLYYVDDVAAPRRVRPVPNVTEHVAALAPDRDGSVWFLSGSALKHWRPDGSVVTVRAAWPSSFEPSAMALGAAGEVWVAGPGGGLFRVSLAGDHVLGQETYGPPNVLSSTVLSVLVDRRGWVWAGTDRGVSVFNRTSWVSVTADTGLVWNDTDSFGLYEDDDGSIWVSTSQGLSHLPHPETLFQSKPVRAVISSLSLGDRLFPTRAVAYTTDPLEVQFGTLDFSAERSIVFCYWLDGVDKAWATTSAASARYPFVPPGHHRFTVVAYDVLTGQASAPVTFTLRIRRAWWASWPMLIGYGLAAALLTVSLWHAKNRHLLHRQHVLEKTVAVRTEQIRVAQEALILQATRDGLTGLLNRAEIQRRFHEMLQASSEAERLVVSLVDIDHFKCINDTHGHLAGDEILQGISERIREMLRPGESAGRYGGEEVLILLTDWDGMAAARILDLNEAIRVMPFQADGRAVSVTCSIGVGWAEADDDWRSLISRIDQALYKAKHEGRDQVREAESSVRVRRG